ncbi:5'/3'-nucleotidase SurE [Myxococcota bacterium]|nr:5'/3'-nucleotidase SurE [Myxococcota bacterium]MBU1381899.1 5'/3'-nucleotidase SurE [Myxococcota bacterium]MBU1497800.1 5'/3'-nucleotidase SurE [Myxococcota bacterium]
MKILLTNDDGITSTHLQILSDTLVDNGFELTVVAPDSEMSAVSHSISLRNPVRMRKIDDQKYAVSGTPADCTYMGMFHIMEKKPDLVISGINNGYNLGLDVYYSGTVAGAMEGVLRGIPGISASIDRKVSELWIRNFSQKISDFAKELLKSNRKPILYNLNCPPVDKINGFMFTGIGYRHYKDEVLVKHDPKGVEYYWLGGPVSKGYDNLEDGERRALEDGYVSVTPMDPLIFSSRKDYMYTPLIDTQTISEVLISI